MKKLLSIAVCAAAVAAFATDQEITLGSVGVTKIACTLTNTVIATSFTDLASDGNVTVSNIVKTTNLSAGDQIIVFKNNNYEAYSLDANGVWMKAVQNITPNGGEATTATDLQRLAVGEGFWLVRGSNWNGTPFDLYIYGKPSANRISNVAAGSVALVGNPTSEAKFPAISTPASNDRIMIPANNKAGMLTYTWNGINWGVQKPSTRIVLESIPAGTGFWYVSTGNSQVTINWNNN